MDITCCTCRQTLDEDRFYWRNKSKGVRQAYCKECKKEYNKKWYANPENRKNQIARSARNNKRYKSAMIEWKIDYVARHGGCSWDGCEEVSPVVIQFDHMDGTTKDAAIADMFRNGYSLAKIEAEAEKCQLLCANHHTLRTAQQFNWEIYSVYALSLLRS